MKTTAELSKEHQMIFDAGYTAGQTKKIEYDKEGWDEEIDRAIQSTLDKVLERIPKEMERKMPNQSYCEGYPDVRVGYNQAINDIITTLTGEDNE